VSLGSVRLLPDSLRDPVLALPPREGRALLRLLGVFGAMLLAVLARDVKQVIGGSVSSSRRGADGRGGIGPGFAAARRVHEKSR
jgi:hypothetical protein